MSRMGLMLLNILSVANDVTRNEKATHSSGPWNARHDTLYFIALYFGDSDGNGQICLD